MSNAEAKLFAVCPTKRESFDVSHVAGSVGEALRLWALDESIESPREVRRLLSRGQINVYAVRKLPVCDSHAEARAEAAIDGFLDTWQQVYGADDDVDAPWSPVAYRQCSAKIEDALRELSGTLAVKRYETFSVETMTTESVIEALGATGVFE
jgi:hypothetical protein